MGDRLDIHSRTLNAKNPKECRSAYSEWAERYDEDLTGEWGYVAPQTTARMLLQTGLSKDALILDAGCGTGLVGEQLAESGCAAIDGLDYSPDMLDQAREKNVYRDLFVADLNAPLDIDTDHYAAIICVGTFTLGHVGPGALNEFVRIARPGAPIVFTVRTEWWKQSNFAAHVEALTAAGRWQRESLEEIDYVRKEGARCIAALFRVA